MEEVIAFAKRGGPVLGICNGFQILTEVGLLPGLLMMNGGLKFICSDAWLKVENSQTIFTKVYKEGEVVRIPIAHADGNYYADDDTLRRLEDNNQVVLRYATENGQVTDDANPNGSRNNIAAIINEGGNVLGTMPHPERACEALVGGSDGEGIFRSIIESGMSL
jgi:phosphoribosylformylglycinamidine synthase